MQRRLGEIEEEGKDAIVCVRVRVTVEQATGEEGIRQTLKELRLLWLGVHFELFYQPEMAVCTLWCDGLKSLAYPSMARVMLTSLTLRNL